MHICLDGAGQPRIQSNTTPMFDPIVDEDTRYGPVNRLGAYTVAYNSLQYERELVFAFHRRSTKLVDADEYRCVGCDRLDPKCQFIIRRLTSFSKKCRVKYGLLQDGMAIPIG